MKKTREISLPCLYCGEMKNYSEESNVGSGVLNAFCDGECEDKFAATL